MKRLSIFIILLIVHATTTFGQDEIIYLQEFNAGNKAFNLEFVKSSDEYKVIIKDKNSDGEKEFSTMLSNLEVFEKQFSDSLRLFSLINIDNELLDLGKRFYYELNAAKTLFSTSVQVPTAGVIEVPSTLNSYVEINGGTILEPITVEKIIIVFEDGYIEDIAVLARAQKSYTANKVRKSGGSNQIVINNNERLKFENQYPIGFSSKTNFRNLKKHKIWEMGGNGMQYVKLDEVLKYLPNIDLDTKDYSPKESRIELKPGEEKILYKPEFNKLFEIIAFTDLVGVDEEKPNGLVQLDFTKRFLLNTSRRKPYGKGINWIPLNYGAMENVEVRALISKIEENNRRLFLDAPPRSPNEAPLVNTIDILNHQVYSLGADFNFFTADWPNLKSRLNLFLGFRYGRTLIADSISTPGTQIDFGINTTAFTPKLRYQLISEKRTGFMMEAGYNHLYTRSDQVKQVDNEAEYLSSGQSQVDPIFFFLMELRYSNNSENGNVFLRYQFNHINGDINQNFSQLQLGYTFDILGRKNK